MNEHLLNNIQTKIKLTTEEVETLQTFWKQKRLAKNEYLVRNGEVCTYDSFIILGSFKAFYIHPETGKEEILFFAIEDWWATDLDSFANQTPSIYNIQALEESVVQQISYQSFEKLLLTIPKFERYFRLILQGYTASIHKRIILTNAHSAQERYDDFLKKYPKIVQKIPQYLIASYLGITPEFLSMLRSKKSSFGS
ncbi:Crp/Fnr family transcriptional regulator [Flavobacterium sp. ZB4P13]|uniref:Crp/Fnr family transcriptional regulator n=1 Tax=Flavobacterium sp. ZB4P13 TaxID=3401728 RepID=UPI003AAB029D